MYSLNVQVHGLVVVVGMEKSGYAVTLTSKQSNQSRDHRSRASSEKAEISFSRLFSSTLVGVHFSSILYIGLYSYFVYILFLNFKVMYMYGRCLQYRRHKVILRLDLSLPPMIWECSFFNDTYSFCPMSQHEKSKADANFIM